MRPLPLDGLRRVPLVLSGRWTSEVREVWTATAGCDQPVVCMSFHVCGGEAHWSKSARLAADSEAVRIGLGIDPSDPSNVTIGCGWIATATRPAQADARPTLGESIALETGVVWPLSRFDSDPAVDVVVLFLVTSDVRWGRNQLWRLHLSRAADVDEPFRDLLLGGRSGTCTWPDP